MKIGKSKLALVVAVLSVALVTTLVYAAFYANRPIGLVGNIVAANGIQVYSDPGCTQVLTTLDFGNIRHGDQVTKEFYIKNTGEQALSPAWNVTNTPSGITTSMYDIALQAIWQPDTPVASGRFLSGGVFDGNFTLTCSPSAALGPFSFTLNVYATA